MDKLIKEINKYPNGTIIIVKWENELKIKGKIDTIYETDNGIEMNENGYKEFYSCVIEILEILNMLSETINLTTGSLMEISMQNPPMEIMLESGAVIWNTRTVK